MRKAHFISNVRQIFVFWLGLACAGLALPVVAQVPANWYHPASVHPNPAVTSQPVTLYFLIPANACGFDGYRVTEVTVAPGLIEAHYELIPRQGPIVCGTPPAFSGTIELGGLETGTYTVRAYGLAFGTPLSVVETRVRVLNPELVAVPATSAAQIGILVSLSILLVLLRHQRGFLGR